MKPYPIIVTGSLAYDHIMTFPGKFADHILPDKIHMLNVAFNIDSLRVDLGGTAGNIAYNLTMLGEKPIIHATAGEDFADYKQKLRELGLSIEHIRIIEKEKTAQAFVTTDLADNQITAFHVGAMGRAFEHPLRELPPCLVIIAPNEKVTMMEHAKFCQKAQLDFIFDPGQAFNAFCGDELIESVKGSKILTVNDYEWELWKQKTGLKEKTTLELTENIIITLGEKGARLISADGKYTIPTIKVKKVVDPTGAGDAFRAGLLYGMKNKMDITESIKFANAVASFCVEVNGTQNHNLNLSMVRDRLI